MTVGEWLDRAARSLDEAGIGSTKLDSQLILEHCTHRSRASLLAHREEDLPERQAKSATELLARRCQRFPLAQILGQREFYGLQFHISDEVLTPRVETEKLVDWAITYAPHGSRVIDMGTGSGAIAIAIAKHRPDLKLTASDISPAALALAQLNASLHRTDITVVESDLWQDLPGRYDVIVTNLPYLSDQAMSELMPEAQHEPQIALSGGGDGLNIYRRFLSDLPGHLSEKGILLTECDPWQQPDLIDAAKAHGLEPINQDYFCLAFRLI